MDVPWSFLDEGHRRLVLEGDEEFPGILGFFRWLEGRKYRVQVRAFLARYRGYQECPACGGSRLRPEALQVRLGGLSIRDVAALSVGAARRFLARPHPRPGGGGDRGAGRCTRWTAGCPSSRTWGSTT